MVLTDYTYIFAIGTIFSLLEAYNNGANDVANSWATSVSSRSISYRWAMILGTVFEMIGAITVGARTASTIKNGIIPIDAFQGNAAVQLLAFACASAGASTWAMWCTRHSAHVSSTYSLISSLAGVGIAAVGAGQVQWGWNGGQGLGAIFAGLVVAPACAAGFGAVIFSTIRLVVHVRRDPVAWAVWTSPFFFLISGTVCTLSIVYKGSPRLSLADEPVWYIASVTLGAGFGLSALSAVFFVPWAHAKVVKRDQRLRVWDLVRGPLLWRRPAAEDSSAEPKVPDYAVVQDDSGSVTAATTSATTGAGTSEAKDATVVNTPIEASCTADPERQQPTQDDYKDTVRRDRERFHVKLRRRRGALGWAMRTLHENAMGAGSVYERHNVVALFRRLPAMAVAALLYGISYDIHAAQTGISGTPEGRRMERVYSYAEKYPNPVEHLYSFVQVLTACTASFAHGANDVGNAVGPWAAMYATWSTSRPAEEETPVPIWQLVVISGTLSIGLVTYGYNIMKVMGNKITYHSPSRGSSMELGAAITVLVFSQHKLPVSTSMCITGATVGVGLCNGTLKAVNWQRVRLLVFSWFMTIPVAGLIGACLMGVMLNAPHF
ncbi:solute carrier family 20 (sodium-dependent phosphate transporter) [Geosmithia morbida]|uniref:Phosphate transporter n=1 Tax=Geosmithia morbida TaxID=1094350 RepID=A0A9P5D5Q5_9HYPO|nr:solute carrier family 20 (sodium-dependent phosphate transporter) [Geosmithia morbida]KAF4122734.1 solute carrier family 20 (sodium-dependent phosphate transporter) [Geosmithia morbida]